MKKTLYKKLKTHEKTQNTTLKLTHKTQGGGNPFVIFVDSPSQLWLPCIKGGCLGLAEIDSGFGCLEGPI